MVKLRLPRQRFNLLDLFTEFGRRKLTAVAPPGSQAGEDVLDLWARQYLRRWWSGHVTAHERASLRTLIRCLNEQQREDLLSRNAFTVNGYTIECTSGVSNILRSTPYQRRLCAVPIAAHGYFDIFLVQKLWIEHREEDFLRVAVSRPTHECGR